MSAAINITAEFKTLGKRAVAPTAWMPELALHAARAVAAGLSEPDDAERLYIAYYDAASKRSGGQSALSHKVQVSKLRCIMKLADERPKQVVKLLERVMELHGGVSDRRVPVYEAMVSVARMQLASSVMLTDAEIRKCCLMKERR